MFRCCTIFNNRWWSLITSWNMEGQTLEDVIERLRNKDPETHKMFKHLNRADDSSNIGTLASAHSKESYIAILNLKTSWLAKMERHTWWIGGLPSILTRMTVKVARRNTKIHVSEQAQSKAIDPRSDLFSIVGVLYEFITLKEHGPKASSALKMLEDSDLYAIEMVGWATSEPCPIQWPIVRCSKRV